jgi:hypothetical protein
MPIGRIAPASGRYSSRRTVKREVPTQRSHSWIVWLVIIAMVAPVTMTVSIGGLLFPPGRVPVILLFLPALVTLTQGVSQGRRHLLATDILMILASAWMMLAALESASSVSIVPTGSDILDLFGSYVLARAYIFGNPAVATFIRALKCVIVVVVACALAEMISGRYLISNLLDPMQTGVRFGLVRAASTFVHPILYGTFCSIATTLLLYSEHNRLRRVFFVSIAVLGALLSLSSAPLMSLTFVLFFYFYDVFMSQYRWRWKVLWAIIFSNLGLVFIVSNAPIAWIISHLIFDSENGYYRLGTWYAAIDQMGLSPIFGFGFYGIDVEYLNRTIDAVWLVIGLRYGLPTIIFFLLANIFSFWRIETNGNGKAVALPLDLVRTGFTAALVVFMFVGLTVDFYDSMWMFWGLCVGIRASLQEDYLASRSAY